MLSCQAFNSGHYQGQGIWLSESTIAVLLISLSGTGKSVVILVVLNLIIMLWKSWGNIPLSEFKESLVLTKGDSSRMKLITSTFSCLWFLYSEVVYCFKLHSDKLSWLLLSWKKILLPSTHWQLFNHALLTEVIILVGTPKWRDFFPSELSMSRDSNVSMFKSAQITLAQPKKSAYAYLCWKIKTLGDTLPE